MIGGGPFLRVARNTLGRDYLVGDVHGQFTKLQRALDAAGFDSAAGDRLFIAGDLVDRGPESEKVLSWLAQPWCYAVRGNHEDMAIRFAEGWGDAELYARNGGAWLISRMPCERGEFAAWLKDLPLAIELETAAGPVGIVHAGCPFAAWADVERALGSASGIARDALMDALLWSRERADGLLDGPVAGVRAVVVGHTPMRRVTSLDNHLFIDTGAWIPGRGEFVLVDAETLEPVRQVRAAA